jgi:hypothetical protein
VAPVISLPHKPLQPPPTNPRQTNNASRITHTARISTKLPRMPRLIIVAVPNRSIGPRLRINQDTVIARPVRVVDVLDAVACESAGAPDDTQGGRVPRDGEVAVVCAG